MVKMFSCLSRQLREYKKCKNEHDLGYRYRNNQKNELFQYFVHLTDYDLMFIKGKKDEMLEKLQIKFGKTKEKLRRIIEGLSPLIRLVLFRIRVISNHK